MARAPLPLTDFMSAVGSDGTNSVSRPSTAKNQPAAPTIMSITPELRSTPGGTSVCKLRVAVNTQRKDGQSGEWVEKANYFDVTVWGAQGENCANYLHKGRPVAVSGRLDWREWADKEGNKRQSVEIIANSVQFLGSRDGSGGGGGGGSSGGGGGGGGGSGW